MAERDEEARAAGLLHTTLGGDEVDVPVLKIAQAREWRAALSKADLNVTALDADVVGELDRPIEVILDLVVAYDVTNRLGGRASLEARASDAEVFALFEEMLAASFPFVARYPLVERFGRLVVAAFYARASSTSGPSPTGDSHPRRSTRASRTNSSSSSGSADRIDA